MAWEPREKPNVNPCQLLRKLEVVMMSELVQTQQSIGLTTLALMRQLKLTNH